MTTVEDAEEGRLIGGGEKFSRLEYLSERRQALIAIQNLRHVASMKAVAGAAEETLIASLRDDLAHRPAEVIALLLDLLEG
jgi:hypothetical protein